MFYLYTGELSPAVKLRHVVHLDELPCSDVGRSNVAYLAETNKVVEGTHCFLIWRLVVNHMNEENIDVISLKTLQAGIDLIEYGCSGQSAMVDVVATVFEFRTEKAGNGCRFLVVYEKADFGDEDEIVPRNVILPQDERLVFYFEQRRTDLFNELSNDRL